MSENTKIPIASLKSIEEDRFSELPNGIVVRGFIKSICQVLNLDVGEYLKEYNAAHGRLKNENIRIYSGPHDGQALKPSSNRYHFILALIVFLIFGSLLFLVIFTPSTIRGSEKLTGSVDHAMEMEK